MATTTDRQRSADTQTPAVSPAPAPTSGIAAALIGPARAAGSAGLVYVAASEARADEIGHVLRQMAPDLEVVLFPPWDCLPYDRASPSRRSMGRRMAALRWIATARTRPTVWIASAEALLQRTPPPQVAAEAVFEIEVGRRLDVEALQAFTARTGYLAHDPVDDPGEISSPAEVIDVFAADAVAPVRIVLAEGVVRELHLVDSATQRSRDALTSVRLGAASEAATADAQARTPGCEHALASFHPALERPLEALRDRPWLSDPDAAQRLIDAHAQIQEAYEVRRALAGLEAERPAAPEALYLTSDELDDLRTRLIALTGAESLQRAQRFAGGPNPGRVFCEAVRARLAEGRRVIVAGDARERRALSRALERGCDRTAPDVSTWDTALAIAPGELAAVDLVLESGFEDEANALTLIAAADVLGGHLGARSPARAAPLANISELALGDVVIHEDHGLCVLRALERVSVDGAEQDAVRLEFHGGATRLAGVEEFGRLWRYGGEPEAVTLDRLGADGWNRRRAAISAEFDRTAAHLVEAAAARAAAPGIVLEPPRAAYARFAARFAHPETPDQAAAIAAVLDDLASGRAMDRLVCGDVGFGKTEVALRAAAAAALAGRQVAVVAPTTVLARQHFLAFQRRFAGTGVEIAHLSRLTAPADLEQTRVGLADGAVGIVVGTHAVAAASVTFADLALVVIDEEQRFGAKIKQRLRALAPHAHRLTLTATPIPRTLERAMIGLQDVSVIATPPSRRRPIRTFVAPFDAATAATALRREARRGGQSFVVTPRIEDIEPIATQLAAVVPELEVPIAHGALPAAEIDAALVGFADGAGDILLATSLIESGIDVPRANTMIVLRPDRFGLAQLHQLRGRVGRGRAQGIAYLLTDPDTPLAPTTAARLATLQANESLGSGIAISARDLDLRGAGDLAGDEQSGQMHTIGADLHQELLTRAVRAAKGEDDAHAFVPQVSLGAEAALPPTWVADATVRINLYARLARLDDLAAVRDFEAELEDRFGPAPLPAAALIAAARLRCAARAAGVTRIDAGPKAIAFRFCDPTAARRTAIPEGAHWKEDRLVWTDASPLDARWTAIEAQLETWAQAQHDVQAAA